MLPIVDYVQKISDTFAAAGLQSRVVGTIHDSISVEVAPGEVDRVMSCLRDVSPFDVVRIDGAQR